MMLQTLSGRAGASLARTRWRPLHKCTTGARDDNDSNIAITFVVLERFRELVACGREIVQLLLRSGNRQMPSFRW